ncbi:hypothetical protein RFI_31484 [Reticulomyxa filosa]|uniref:Uncharacterized protein n=1 Tax=Reticulomyxa filosa TaxID=46433 RepID=X6LXQ3_RETFI|nr:hypothetical protein RFI_31484 [Reticulomyxa filosa]|eukprot:ETO05912.1 hypothetical protein RFI_31484 [Reticulomyxa filosa]
MNGIQFLQQKNNVSNYMQLINIYISSNMQKKIFVTTFECICILIKVLKNKNMQFLNGAINYKFLLFREKKVTVGGVPTSKNKNKTKKNVSIKDEDSSSDEKVYANANVLEINEDMIHNKLFLEKTSDDNIFVKLLTLKPIFGSNCNSGTRVRKFASSKRLKIKFFLIKKKKVNKFEKWFQTWGLDDIFEYGTKNHAELEQRLPTEYDRYSQRYGWIDANINANGSGNNSNDNIDGDLEAGANATANINININTNINVNVNEHANIYALMELVESDIKPYLFIVCNEFKEYEIGNRQGKNTKTNAMDSWLNSHIEANVNNEDDDDRNEKDEEKWHMMPQTTKTTTTTEEETLE